MAPVYLEAHIHWVRPGRALILRARRAGEDLEVGEGEDRQAHLYVGRDADVDATERSTDKIFSYIVRGHKDRVEVSAARTTAAIHFDLSGNVGAVGRRYAARGREGLRVNRLAEAVHIGEAAVVRALHLDVKGSHVMIVEVHVLAAETVDPLAVIT